MSELAAGFRTLAGKPASARLRIPPAKVFEFADGGVFEHENTGRQEARKSLAVFLEFLPTNAASAAAGNTSRLKAEIRRLNPTGRILRVLAGF
jgi:hypothetical protein